MADDTGTKPKADGDKGRAAPAAEDTGKEEASKPKVLTRIELDDYRESLRRRFHSV
ncbi:MAG TPA: hypothetical protein VJT14_06665 [Candidatus Dormibacteraeota bacterium]|nr:hypothetical protein [Candidatus Dormibacteraeota bacterium]